MPELIKFIPEHINALGIKVKMIYVEPKASGKSIKQLIQSQTSLNITELKSKFVSVSKIERARSASPYIEGGRVKLVNGNWIEHFLHQIAVFPNGKHDEHIDLTSYGIENKLIEEQFFTF
jgi:predicted phage terminase large subunit-like protein